MNVSLSLSDLLSDEFQHALQEAVKRAFLEVQPQLAATEPGRLFVGADKAAEIASVCPKTLWNYSAPRGPIPSYKIGTRTLYDPDEIKAAIKNMRQEGGGA